MLFLCVVLSLEKEYEYHLEVYLFIDKLNQLPWCKYMRYKVEK